MTAFGPLLPLSRGSRSSGLQPGGSLRQRGRILAPIHVSGVHASGDPGTRRVLGGGRACDALYIIANFIELSFFKAKKEKEKCNRNDSGKQAR